MSISRCVATANANNQKSLVKATVEKAGSSSNGADMSEGSAIRALIQTVKNEEVETRPALLQVCA